MLIPSATGSMTGFNNLMYNSSTSEVVVDVSSRGGTTGVFGGPSLDSTADLTSTVSALRLPNTYTPVHFGASLHTSASTTPDETAIVLGNHGDGVPTGKNCIALGNWSASKGGQNDGGIAIGTDCAYESQGSHAISIGNGCASKFQGSQSIALGPWAMINNAGTGSIGIGANSSKHQAGKFSIALGFMAGTVAGPPSQGVADNSIVISALGTGLVNQTPSSLKIAPIRFDGNPAGKMALSYDPGTSEITFAPPKAFPQLPPIPEFQSLEWDIYDIPLPLSIDTTVPVPVPNGFQPLAFDVEFTDAALDVRVWCQLNVLTKWAGGIALASDTNPDGFIFRQGLGIIARIDGQEQPLGMVNVYDQKISNTNVTLEGTFMVTSGVHKIELCYTDYNTYMRIPDQTKFQREISGVNAKFGISWTSTKLAVTYNGAGSPRMGGHILFKNP